MNVNNVILSYLLKSLIKPIQVLYVAHHVRGHHHVGSDQEECSLTK